MDKQIIQDQINGINSRITALRKTAFGPDMPCKSKRRRLQ